MSITIRPYRLTDLYDLVAHASNSAIMATVRDSFPNPYMIEHGRYWIQSCFEDDQPGVWRWGICLHDRIIGGIGAIRD
jgi:RimJ/RimL family protein N-acetyltransferase